MTAKAGKIDPSGGARSAQTGRAHIANHYVLACIRGALRRGYEAEPLLLAAGIPGDWVGQPARLITEQQLAALVKAVWRTARDEFMGFTTVPCKNGTFALMTEYCREATTLGALMSRTARFYGIVRDDIDIALDHGESCEERAFFRIHLNDRDGDQDHLLQEFLLLLWQRFFCWMADQQIPYLATHFDYPSPPHAAEYRAMYSGELLYEQPRCGFSLHPKYLGLAVGRSEQDLADFLRESPAYVLHRPSQDPRLRSRIRALLSRCDYRELPDLDTLSRQLHSTPRNVRRKLALEGTSFSEIKAGLRRELAVRLLTAEHLSIAEVGERVGFSETAAFCRAFKRWTGRSPSAWSPPPRS